MLKEHNHFYLVLVIIDELHRGCLAYSILGVREGLGDTFQLLDKYCDEEIVTLWIKLKHMHMWPSLRLVEVTRLREVWWSWVCPFRCCWDLSMKINLKFLLGDGWNHILMLDVAAILKGCWDSLIWSYNYKWMMLHILQNMDQFIMLLICQVLLST